MKLSDTVEMMNSEDYKERFKAEYYQLLNRIEGLVLMLSKWDSGILNFSPICPKEIYTVQLYIMNQYLEILEDRARMEGIEVLNDINFCRVN